MVSIGEFDCVKFVNQFLIECGELLYVAAKQAMCV
jgi:hypothetical protein